MSRVIYSKEQAQKFTILETGKQLKAYRNAANSLREKSTAAPKRSKYGNKKITHGTEVFDSIKERNRWLELKVMEKLGVIKNLRRQITFPFLHNGILICKYIADFSYDKNNYAGLHDENRWTSVVEDVKSAGTKTRLYSVKRKCMKAFHGIDILET